MLSSGTAFSLTMIRVNPIHIGTVIHGEEVITKQGRVLMENGAAVKGYVRHNSTTCGIKHES